MFSKGSVMASTRRAMVAASSSSSGGRSLLAVDSTATTTPRQARSCSSSLRRKSSGILDNISAVASWKIAYELLEKPGLQLFAGVYNIFNMYQQDFDRGPDRDAGYIYGPMRPRAFFAGITVGM